MYPLRLFIAAILLVATSFTGPSNPAQSPSPQSNDPVLEATVASKPVLFPAPTTTTTQAPTTTTQPPPPPTTTTTEAPAPSPASTGECGGYESLVASYFPAEQVAKACAVMGCETGYTYDPTIYNRSGSGASGLFQFMPSTWRSTTGTEPPAAAYGAETQIAAGAALWQEQGWAPWSCA